MPNARWPTDLLLSTVAGQGLVLAPTPATHALATTAISLAQRKFARLRRSQQPGSSTNATHRMCGPHARQAGAASTSAKVARLHPRHRRLRHPRRHHPRQHPPRQHHRRLCLSLFHRPVLWYPLPPVLWHPHPRPNPCPSLLWYPSPQSCRRPRRARTIAMPGIPIGRKDGQQVRRLIAVRMGVAGALRLRRSQRPHCRMIATPAGIIAIIAWSSSGPLASSHGVASTRTAGVRPR